MRPVEHDWHIRRNEVIERDGRVCSICGVSDRRLLVHHQIYNMFEGYETPTKYLITVCEDCHGKIHSRPYEKPLPKPKSENRSFAITIRTPDLANFTRAAKMLGVSRPTIYNLIEKQRLHIVAFGRNRYLLRTELEKFTNNKSGQTQIET